MADRVFIQKSRIGRNVLLLRDDSLEVTWSLGTRKESFTLPLKTISTEYERVSIRIPILFIFPLLLCLPVVGAVYFILMQDGSRYPLVLTPGLFLFFLLYLAAKGLRPVDRFQFYNHWKKPAFYIVREKNQAEECDSFIQELLFRIESTEKRTSPDQVCIGSDADSLVSLTAPDTFGFLRSREYRWKTSITMGMLSAGMPWVPYLATLLDSFLFAFVFMNAVGGIGFCVLSYQSKERLRHLSLVGAALCLVGPILY